jgi:hypothetical protein
MAKRKRPPKVAGDLLEEAMLDREIQEAIFKAVSQTPADCFIVVRIPAHLVRRLSELNSRRQQQSRDN